MSCNGINNNVIVLVIYKIIDIENMPDGHPVKKVQVITVRLLATKTV